ncbi:ATP-binding protein [Halocatena salina]|uniref:ATP-binding protein n=1 Tax=Halocatena salina TaxID=2934340 RepID=A0A8U0ABW5_9EURY|nr:ATP-binding protein [Halocatena salina]UPM45353.1 ATP-binding protein [Halocatena salina]
MVVEALGVGVFANLAYDTLKRGKAEVDEEQFLQNSIENAIEDTAKQYEVSPAALEAIFTKELDTDTVENFHQQDREDVMAELAAALAEEADKDVDVEGAAREFVELFQQNVARRPSSGIPLLVDYVQKLSDRQAELSGLRDLVHELRDELRDDLGVLENHTKRALERDELYPGIDFQIHESQVNRIVERLRDRRATTVVGPGGVGKSTVLRTVIRNWEPPEPVYFIDARELGRVTTRGGLRDEFALHNSLLHVIKRMRDEFGGCLIAFDQLDSVRGRGTDQVLRDVLLDCADLENVSVLCACRAWDYEERREYRRLRESERFASVELSPLDEANSRRVLIEMGVPERDISEELVDLGTSPLHLSLIASIGSDDSDAEVNYSTIEEDVSLWEQYRESLIHRKSDVADTKNWDIVRRAAELARESLRSRDRRVTIERGRDEDERLVSRGVLEHVHGRQHRFWHEQLEAYFYARDATDQGWFAAQVVNDRIDERVAADALCWMAKIYRTQEPELAAQFVRRALSETAGKKRHSLGYYAGVQLVEEIGSWDAEILDASITNSFLNALEERSRLATAFYNGLYNPLWISPLLEQNRLIQPTRPMAQYLERVATEVPEAVERVVHITESEDELVLCRLLSAIEQLPDEFARRNATVFASWLRRTAKANHFGDRLVEFTTTLVDDGRAVDALPVFKALLQPRTSSPTKSQSNEPTSDSLFSARKKAEPVVAIYLVEDVIERTMNGFLHQTGTGVIDVLTRNLRLALDFETEVREMAVEDITWPREIESITSVRNLNLKEHLLTTLRDSLQQWIEGNPSSEDRERIVASYLGGIGVFKRLGLYLLHENLEIYPGLTKRELMIRSNYFEPRIQYEFLPLLRDGFSILSDDDQHRILEIIDDGANREVLRKRAEEAFPERSNQEHAQNINDSIDRQRLIFWWVIRNELPSKYTQKLDELVDQYGEPNDPTTAHMISEGGAVERKGPVDEEELAQYTPREVIDLCIDWEPDSHPDEGEGEEFLIERTPRGLSEQVSKLIKEQPDAFVSELPRLSQAENPLYVAACLGALRSAVEDGRTFDWNPVLKLCERIVKEGSDEWSVEARISVCWLLLTTSQENPGIVIRHANRIESMLLSLTADPHPVDDTPSPKETKQSRDHFNETHDAVRPLALLGLASFSLRKADRRDFDGSTAENRSALEPDVRERIATLFEDSSLSVPAAIGSCLWTLWRLDPALVESNLDRVFPLGDSQVERQRFGATWNGYIAQNGVVEPIFELLRERYFRGVDLLLKEEVDHTPGMKRRQAGHVMKVYVNEIEDLSDDSLVNHFYSVASPDDATQAITTLLNWSGEQPSPSESSYWPLVRDLWQWRLRTVADPTEYSREFTYFIQYLNSMEEEPDLLSVEQLLVSSIPAVVTESSGWDELESYLLTEISEHTGKTIKVYSELVMQDDWPPLRDFDEKSKKLVETALQNEQTHDLGLDIAERIAERQDPTFTEFITEHIDRT